MTQPDLIPTAAQLLTLTVGGPELPATLERIRNAGGVVIRADVKLATYKLEVVLPPGAMANHSLTEQCHCQLCED